MSVIDQGAGNCQLDVSEPPSKSQCKCKWRVEAVPTDFHYQVMVNAGRSPDEYPRYRWYCETKEEAKELANRLVDVDVGIKYYFADGFVET
jgi:hypothetical protein